MNFKAKSSSDDVFKVEIEIHPSEVVSKTNFRMMEIMAEKAANELYEKSREMLFAYFDDARMQAIVNEALKERVLEFFRLPRV